MSADGTDTERTAVKTYVPAYQKTEWRAHADDLGMSQSEFVRTMVQAGRRDFDLDPVEPHTSGSDPGGCDLESRVLGLLESGGALSWDELLATLTDNVEADLEELLQELQEANRIRYSGREGGYTLVEGSE